jgi:phosphoribosyl-AMP cyclohydrolase
MSDTKPTTKPVKTAKRGTKTYQLFANGELWMKGKHVDFCCGYVMDPENIEDAVDVHEDEMRCLIEQARTEFGF